MASSLAGVGLIHERKRIGDRGALHPFVVIDGDAEFVFQSHGHLDKIERIASKIANECVGQLRFLIEAELALNLCQQSSFNTGFGHISLLRVIDRRVFSSTVVDYICRALKRIGFRVLVFQASHQNQNCEGRKHSD
jgi:hypothetical protein